MDAAVSFFLAFLVLAGWILLGLATIGSLYTFLAALVFRRFFSKEPPFARRHEGVTVLKPLCGHEPRLKENLSTYLQQDHDGPLQLLCGVARGDDPATETVRSLAASRSDASIALVACPARHGASAKISNLINLTEHVAHPYVVLSDSDIVVGPKYIGHLLAALDRPEVGAVTALYFGRGDAGIWSSLGAAGLSYQFLPGAVFGVAFGIARPCMGSTIAMKTETLRRIGGFHSFANILSDDYAIGVAIRELGLEVDVPPMLVAHASTESTFRELWQHELRWSATVRSAVPLAYLGSVISMPFPLAFAGMLLTGQWIAGSVILVAAFASRMTLVKAVDRQVGSKPVSSVLLPLRDGLTFFVYIASFFVRTVDWRGKRHPITTAGAILPDSESLA
jgi:ceramide glucosyltransferase